MRLYEHACVLLGFDVVSLHIGLLLPTIDQRALSFEREWPSLLPFLTPERGVLLNADLLDLVPGSPHNGLCVWI